MQALQSDLDIFPYSEQDWKILEVAYAEINLKQAEEIEKLYIEYINVTIPEIITIVKNTFPDFDINFVWWKNESIDEISEQFLLFMKTVWKSVWTQSFITNLEHYQKLITTLDPYYQKNNLWQTILERSMGF